MVKLNDAIHWKEKKYTCIGVKRGDGSQGTKGSNYEKYEWAARCDCGDNFSFRAFLWEWPMLAPSAVEKSKVFRSACTACAKRRVRNRFYSVVDDAFDSAARVILFMLDRSDDGMTMRDMEKRISHFDLSWVEEQFPLEKHHLARAFHESCVNAHKRSGGGIFSHVMTKGRKRGLWDKKEGLWKLPKHGVKPEGARRLDEGLEGAIRAVTFVLTTGGIMTAPEIREKIDEIHKFGALSEGAQGRLSVNTFEVESRAAALMRVLIHMMTYGQVAKHGTGRGTRWCLPNMEYLAA